MYMFLPVGVDTVVQQGTCKWRPTFYLLMQVAVAQHGLCSPSKQSPGHRGDVFCMQLRDITIRVHGGKGSEGHAVRHGQQVTGVPDSIWGNTVIGVDCGLTVFKTAPCRA